MSSAGAAIDDVQQAADERLARKQARRFDVQSKAWRVNSIIRLTKVFVPNSLAVHADMILGSVGGRSAGHGRQLPQYRTPPPRLRARREGRNFRTTKLSQQGTIKKQKEREGKGREQKARGHYRRYACVLLRKVRT